MVQKSHLKQDISDEKQDVQKYGKRVKQSRSLPMARAYSGMQRDEATHLQHLKGALQGLRAAQPPQKDTPQ